MITAFKTDSFYSLRWFDPLIIQEWYIWEIVKKSMCSICGKNLSKVFFTLIPENSGRYFWMRSFKHEYLVFF